MSERASITLKIAGEPKRIEFDMPAGPVQPAELLPVLRQFSNVMVEAAKAAQLAKARLSRAPVDAELAAGSWRLTGEAAWR